jgi:hypothetical protein
VFHFVKNVFQCAKAARQREHDATAEGWKEAMQAERVHVLQVFATESWFLLANGQR